MQNALGAKCPYLELFWAEFSAFKLMNTLSEIKNLRLRNVNEVIIGNININSLPSKFEQLKELVIKYIDLVITETKLDDSFPTSQFLMKGFAEPFRLD